MSRNDTDKLVDLLFYIIPKYMNEYEKSENRRKKHRKREEFREEFNEEEIFKNIKALALDNNELNKKEQNLNKANVDNHDEKEKNIKEDKGEENKKNTYEKENSSTNKNFNTIKSEKNLNSRYGIRSVLKKLIDKKVTFYIADSIKDLINNATIMRIENNIIELRTEENKTIILAIDEIVAIKSTELSTITYSNEERIVDNNNRDREDEFRLYFDSIIGKRISIQTKGSKELRYMNNKVITATGSDFIVIENNIILLIDKIILVEI